MSDTFVAAFRFLITTLFDLYLFVLMLRVILAYVGANYFDPITQFIIKLTDFAVKPLRRLIPNVRGVEVASLILIFALQLIKFFLIIFLTFGFPAILGLIILALGDTLKIVFEIFFYAILLQAIMSWIQPYSPANRLLYQITAPIMQPLRRVIPPVGGIDISPIPALIILQLLIIVIVYPLMRLGWGAIVG